MLSPNPTVASAHVAPLFKVTGPAKVIARAVILVELKLIVPETEVAPLTVKSRNILIVPPLLIVSEEAV